LTIANELALLSYASIDDIITNNFLDNAFTDLGVSTGFSTTGIDFDGSLFHVMFETDDDVVGGTNELALLSYASIDDIITNNFLDNAFTNLGVSTGFSTTGIYSTTGFGPGPVPEPVPEPGSLFLFSLGLLGVGVARRRKKV